MKYILSLLLWGLLTLAADAQDHFINRITKTTYLTPDSTSHSCIDECLYDGLGYKTGLISNGTHNSRQAVVALTKYDAMHRSDSVTPLPFPLSIQDSLQIGTTDLSEIQTDWYRERYSDSSPFTRKQYEPWAGGRLLSAQRAGDSWCGIVSTYTYGVNSDSDEIRRFRYDTVSGNLLDLGFWPSGTLSTVTATSEDGARSIVYSDASSRKICSRAFDSNSNSIDTARKADTYFLYDERDSLVCIVQPGGELFTWKYDNHGNVLEHSAPGGGVSYYTYDSRDRLVTECSSKMAELGMSKHIVYDACNRPVSEYYTRDFEGGVVQTRAYEYYPYGSSAPTGSRGRLLRESIWAAPSEADTALIAGTPTGYFISKTYTYNIEGRLSSTTELWPDGWCVEIVNAYDFTGNLISVIETHSGTTNGIPFSCSMQTVYSHDDRGRITECHRNIDGEPLAVVLYSYDGLGRLSSRRVTEYGGADGEEGAELLAEMYSYDIHGWQTYRHTDIVNSDNSIFSENLRYADTSIPGDHARYDGLISEASTVQSGFPTHTFAYSYDGMGRLTGAEHFRGTSLLPYNCDTEKSISYDTDGNILSMMRYGTSDSHPQPLSFSYSNGKLDSANGLTFLYDSAGNMIRDRRKGLSFSYNVLNLLSLVRHDDGNSLIYRWLSDGTKVSVMAPDGSGRLYRGSFVYLTDAQGGITLESVEWDGGRVVLFEDNAIPDVPADN